MKKLPLLLTLFMLFGCGHKQKDIVTNTDTVKIITTDAGTPVNYKSLFNDGINFYNAKQYEDAVTAFKKSNQLNPKSKTDYYIALSYNVMKNCDSSTIYAQKVLKIGDGDNEHTVNSTKMIAGCSPAVVNNPGVTTEKSGQYEFKKIIPAKDHPVFSATDSAKFKIINTTILQSNKNIHLKLQQLKHF